MGDWRIERLERSHERDRFTCGRPPLDEFILRLVTQYEKRNLGRTYVAVGPGEKRVIGYYTLACGNIAFQNLPRSTAKKLPRPPAPVLLLARLAVDLVVQGRGLGEALLIDALDRCMALADKIGVHAVEVHAIDSRASDFYQKYGFTPLLDSELHLYLPVATVPEELRRERGP